MRKIVAAGVYYDYAEKLGQIPQAKPIEWVVNESGGCEVVGRGHARPQWRDRSFEFAASWLQLMRKRNEGKSWTDKTTSSGYASIETS